MGQEAHLKISRVSRRLVRVLMLTCVALGVLVASPAYATAPICDEQAQSILAPLPLRAVPTTELGAIPCHSSRDQLQSAPAPNNDFPVTSPQAPERAWPTYFPWAHPKGTRLPLDPVVRLYLPAGFATSVYRPPRA